MTDWLPSTEKWPRHPKQWWREVIDLARERNWYFLAVEGHAWGHISCHPSPASANTSERCLIHVFSTGKSAENVAKDAGKAIRKCPHSRPTPEVLIGADRVVTLVKEARVLVRGARELIAGKIETANADDQLRFAESLANDAEQELALMKAQQLEESGFNRVEKGKGLLGRLVPGIISEHGALDAAEQRLDQAEPSASPRHLQKSIESVRREIQTLRVQLAKGS